MKIMCIHLIMCAQSCIGATVVPFGYYERHTPKTAYSFREKSIAYESLLELAKILHMEAGTGNRFGATAHGALSG